MFQSKDSLSVCAPSISSFSFSVPLFRIDAEEEVLLSRSLDWEGWMEEGIDDEKNCVSKKDYTYIYLRIK